MTLHTIVDGYCQPPMTERTPAMIEYEVPEGYKYTTLPRGQGKYDYEELDTDWRNNNNEGYITKQQLRFIFRGHQRKLNIPKYAVGYSH